MWVSYICQPDMILPATFVGSFGTVRDHHKYRNNLDYNLTLLLLNNSRHLAADYLILAENEALHAPLATVYYQHYQDEEELRLQLEVWQETCNVWCL